MITWALKCFSHRLEDLSSISQKPHEKLGLTEHNWNPSASGMEKGRSLGLLTSQSIQSARCRFSETPFLNTQGRMWLKRKSSVDSCPQPPYICTYTRVHMPTVQTHKYTHTKYERGVWPLLIPALRGERQEDLCEFKTSMIHKGTSRTARATQRYPD